MSGMEITRASGMLQNSAIFFFNSCGTVAVAAAKQKIGLNSDGKQLLHGMLRRLGFQFAGRGDERHQRHVHEDEIFRTEFQPHLPDRFEERKRFDVADRAADFDDHHVGIDGDLAERSFDFVGDVRNHLHGLAQVIAAPLLREDGLVDSAGGPVVIARKFGVGEPLVVSEVEVGFGAVVGDVHFAVLIRAHRARIHVQVGIAFLEGNSETPAFEQAANRRRCHAFAQGGYNTTGNKNILRPHPLSSGRLKNTGCRTGLNPPERCWRTTHSTGKARHCQRAAEMGSERSKKYNCRALLGKSRNENAGDCANRLFIRAIGPAIRTLYSGGGHRVRSVAVVIAVVVAIVIPGEQVRHDFGVGVARMVQARKPESTFD